jgi:hypothetical protein
MDLKSAIHPGALDLMLSSATNATDKGQSQYSTPVELATALAEHLPEHRPVLVDLTCGRGNLLLGCVNKRTEYLLGLDVDPRGQIGSQKGEARWVSHFIHCDLTTLYEPMRQIDFRADCFVLNPPWSLNWHRTRLEGLADSPVPAVARTFKSGGGDSHIDSTLATLLIALDRLTDAGEGLLIGYSSTLERLLFAKGAIGAPVARHIWKVAPLAKFGLELPEPLQKSSVIYFSRSHDTGPTADGRKPPFLERVGLWNCRRETVEQWQALSEHARATLPNAAPKYHLSLVNQGGSSAQIRVRLGLFDSALAKVNGELAKAAKRLYALEGRNPMQVVMQRDERNFVLGLLREPQADARHVWTIDPALRDAVQKAVNEYNAIRAPLVPLPKIQRLGYLDESDDILCVKALAVPGTGKSFEAGQRYPLATRSMRFTRTQFKPNLHGEEEELELSGQELAILIRLNPDNPDDEFCFMDGALRHDNVRVGDDAGTDVVNFTLQQLVDHFEIPDVPDIARAHPSRFENYVAQLHQLEQLTD